jgi:hypothetical protein
LLVVNVFNFEKKTMRIKSQWLSSFFENQKKVNNQIVQRKKFVFFPIAIEDQTVFLEFVLEEGYWWKGASGTWWWEPTDIKLMPKV